MPPVLPALVTHHRRRLNAYLARAQHLRTLHGDRMKQWQRLVLYALTDALAHNHLLVGTLAAHLQRQDLDPDLLRHYLRSLRPRPLHHFRGRPAPRRSHRCRTRGSGRAVAPAAPDRGRSGAGHALAARGRHADVGLGQ
ncbi:hypothetical protein AB0A94_37350 [Streptomyces sp. NPDC044984]|uniref:hypothetical protein n=1 Tax=Streptomyces sp. NPDC044984 TaxID=3154335 RepID=UPI0033E2E4B8